MLSSLAQFGASTRKAVSVSRLLRNVGVLARDRLQQSEETGIEADLDADAEDDDSAGTDNETGSQYLDPCGKVTLGARLAAWWNGNLILERGGANTTVEAIAPDRIDLTRWGAQRLMLVQQLWGESFLEPGGADRARKLFSHVMPNPKQSVMDLTTGLGGTAFTLAQAQDIWIDALEPDADLAAAALKAASVSGLGRQVSVRRIDVDAIGIPKNKYDLAYSRERLFALSQKLELLTSAGDSLKEDGNLVITDLMIPAPEMMDTEGYRAWTGTEPVMPQPWTMALYTKSLEDCGLKIAGRQDFTKDYLADIHAGWQKIAVELESGQFDRSLAEHFLAEGEVWAGRAKALETGVISYCRIIARRAT